jgi:hypothetical protein
MYAERMRDKRRKKLGQSEQERIRKKEKKGRKKERKKHICNAEIHGDDKCIHTERFTAYS